jgi:hypothetical protein
VLYAFVLGVFVYRTLTFAAIVQTLIRTSLITGVVFLILASASIFSWWMTYMQIPQAIAKLFLSISRNPQVVIGLILGLPLIVGMFMDINAALIILAPVLGPLTATIGMDPVHARGDDHPDAEHLAHDPAGRGLPVRDQLGHRRAHHARALALHPARDVSALPDRLLAEVDALRPPRLMFGN